MLPGFASPENVEAPLTTGQSNPTCLATQHPSRAPRARHRASAGRSGGAAPITECGKELGKQSPGLIRDFVTLCPHRIPSVDSWNLYRVSAFEVGNWVPRDFVQSVCQMIDGTQEKGSASRHHLAIPPSPPTLALCTLRTARSARAVCIPGDSKCTQIRALAGT